MYFFCQNVLIKFWTVLTIPLRNRRTDHILYLSLTCQILLSFFQKKIDNQPLDFGKLKKGIFEPNPCKWHFLMVPPTASQNSSRRGTTVASHGRDRPPALYKIFCFPLYLTKVVFFYYLVL